MAESIDRSPVEAISDWPDDILIRGWFYHADFSKISPGFRPEAVRRVAQVCLPCHTASLQNLKYIYSWAWAVAAVGSRSLGREAIELQPSTIAATGVSSRPGTSNGPDFLLFPRRGINSFNNDHERRMKFERRPFVSHFNARSLIIGK